MLAQMSERMGEEHYDEERAETAEALAGGDDDDGGVDRRASGDGHARLSEPSRVSPEEAGPGVVNIKNCPIFLTLFSGEKMAGAWVGIVFRR